MSGSRSAEVRVAIVTGGSSGLGKALVAELVRRGWRVAAGARRDADLERLAGEGVLPLRLEVTDDRSVAEAVDAAVAWGGRLDLVVNNAGWGLIGPTAELEIASLADQLDVNLVGPVRLVRAALPALVESGGRVVNVGSVSGVTATPFAGAYCASKAGLHLLSDALRMELAPFGVAVVVVQPGAVASRFGERSSSEAVRYGAEGSPWAPVADAIEARARLSENDPTPADEAARRILAAALARRPPAVVRVGRGSRLLPLIGRLPAQWRDRLLSRRFGLDRLRRVPSDRG
jgi:NAD(P)-dependent dehydrogenase (short-subunit alcohol dehydrogenase family)